MNLSFRKQMTGFIMLFLGVMASTVFAEESYEIAGLISSGYEQKEIVSIPDKAGHTVMFTQSKGVNKSTGQKSYMNGAAVIGQAFSDLEQGNGIHNGYTIFNQGEEQSVIKWQGNVTTVNSEDGQAVTTFAGSWSTVGGKGKFAGIKGLGTYKGRLNSEQEYVVEWSGSITY